MSVEDVKGFLLKLSTDQEFFAAVDGAPSTDDRLRLAREAGYEFDQNDFEQAARDVLEAQTVEELVGPEQAEVVGYLGMELLNIQRRLVTFYGDSAFFARRGAVSMASMAPPPLLQARRG